MVSFIIKKTPVFFVPTAVLIATWFLIPEIPGLSPSHQDLVALMPYAVTVLGVLLSLHFHRGRPFMALLLLASFYWCSQSLHTIEEFEPSLNQVYQAFILLIPLNIMLLTFMRERGVFSTAGRMRLVFLVLQAVSVLWLFNQHFLDLVPYLGRSFVQWPLFDSLQIPQPAIIAALICFIIIVVLALRRQTPIDSGMLGALTAFLIAGNSVINRDVHAAYSGAAALILTMSVLQDSYNMAFRDDLTGMPSRRSLNECLHGLGRKYTLAMLDVDHFKKFNDTYGHDVGDQVLKMVAKKMMDVGGGGKAYRYGGEEFTIVFSRCRVEDVLPYLEELRKSIAEYRMALRSDDRPKAQQQGKGSRGSRAGRSEGAFASVTVSIGVAESGEDLKSTADVMKAADKALYKSKNRGRNQISC